MDKSNGYEKIAKEFIEIRGQNIDGIGTSSVQNWIKSFPEKAKILDLGCGTGIPITKVILDEGMKVFAIDSSVTLIKVFQKNFPNTPVKCEAAENSQFFNQKFDGIIAWGLIFLLSKETQIKILQKASDSLNFGGKLLFTAPKQKTEWEDLMTKQKSISLGAKKYKEVLHEFGLTVIEEFIDEGENYYFNAIKN